MDARYRRLFEPIVARVMEVFRPDAIVLQCGADSLAGDRIAGLGLSVRGHAECVCLLPQLRTTCPCSSSVAADTPSTTSLPVGAMRLDKRTVAIGKEIPDDIPQHGYQSQGYKLHYDTARNGNGNLETKHMVNIKRRVMKHLEQLSALLAAPAAQRN
ncbi:hypothetical protein EJB05_28852, partial [Eragrostis curvula]